MSNDKGQTPLPKVPPPQGPDTTSEIRKGDTGKPGKRVEIRKA